MKKTGLFIISTLFGTILMAESSQGMEEAQRAFMKEDYTKAFAIYSELARKGDMKAQNFCAGMYEFAQGVAKDDVKALYWYEKAAEQGMRSAQQTVGFRYMQGIGTPVDLAKSAYWYDKSTAKSSAQDSQIFAQWFDPRSAQNVNN